MVGCQCWLEIAYLLCECTLNTSLHAKALILSTSESDYYTVVDHFPPIENLKIGVLTRPD